VTVADQVTQLSQLEMQSLAAGLTQFLTEYDRLISPKSADQVSNAVTVLRAIAPLGHRPLSSSPQPRICGLCPCEISDLVKNGEIENMTDTYPVGTPTEESKPKPPPPPPPPPSK